MTTLFHLLASDYRLHDLFGQDQQATTTQLWILEIDRAGATELRFLYARSLAGCHQSHKWSGSCSAKTVLYDGCWARTHTLTLHTSTQRLKIFLDYLFANTTLHGASRMADIHLDDKVEKKLGSLLFGEKPVARPVMHLPTRDLFQFRTRRLSPTAYASVDSAAISCDGKAETFAMLEGLDRTLAKAACERLNADTGMDFTALDAWRIGDFEFICSPNQSRAEKSRYDITLKGDDASLVLYEAFTRDPTDLLVVINAYSDDSVLATHTARLGKDEGYPRTHRFNLEALEKQICTSFTLEIYALSASGDVSFLVLQTGSYFVRSMNLNMQVVEPVRANGRFDWLSKQVPAKEQAQLQATARVGRALRDSRSQLGGHADDPWVALNRSIETTMKQLCPAPSTGRFFLTLSDSGGTSRIELSQWLRQIFEKHHDAQIAWFDPFMEDVGIELLHRMGTATGDYLIITTEKEPNAPGNAGAQKPSRIGKLLDQCAGWGNGYFGNVRLKVLAVPESKIHDRMILIRSANGRPLAGYQLSNSIQRANDNYPLLATPIPLDVMPQVFDYCDQILQSTVHGDGKHAPSAKLIFDSASFSESTDEPEANALHQRSCFSAAPRSGDVLAWWLDDAELAGSSGAELMAKLDGKGRLSDGRLEPELFEQIPAKFWSQGLPLEEFHTAWDALGYVLAHCSQEPLYVADPKPLAQPLQSALLAHLEPARRDALQPMTRKALLDLEHYRAQPLASLLLSAANPHDAFSYSPPDTAWSDYYALKLLWTHAPQVLVDWLSEVCASPIKGLRPTLLVIEALKLVCLSLSFDKHHERIEALLRSESSIINWVGLDAFKNAINDGTWGVETLGLIDQVRPASVQRTLLCWLINEANYVGADIKPALITKLVQSIDGPLTDQQLDDLVQPLRGRLGRLHQLTPWILESLLVPLLEQQSISCTQVCKAWFNELASQWRESLTESKSVYFKLAADGAFTDELALLTRYLEDEEQAQMVQELWRIFNTLARTIRRPFSAQVSWQAHIRAHEVNLWLCGLARRIDALSDVRTPSLTELLRESRAIIDRLPERFRDYAASTELLGYVEGDAGELETHRLAQVIQQAVSH